MKTTSPIGAVSVICGGLLIAIGSGLSWLRYTGVDEDPSAFDPSALFSADMFLGVRWGRPALVVLGLVIVGCGLLMLASDRPGGTPIGCAVAAATGCAGFVIYQLATYRTEEFEQLVGALDASGDVGPGIATFAVLAGSAVSIVASWFVLTRSKRISAPPAELG